MINGCPTQKGDSKAEGRRARARPEKNLTRDLFEGESLTGHYHEAKQ